MKKITFFLMMLLAVMSFSACFNGNDENKEEETTNSDESNNSSTASDNSPTNLAEAMQQVQKGLKDANIGQEGEPVNHRELQKFLPEKMAGMKRVKKSGQTSGAMGFKISNAEATYKDESSGKTFQINIVDTGGFSVGIMSMAAWSTLTIDKEDENGYERTAKLDGFKSYEKYEKRRNKSELSLILNKRFVLQGNCRDCEMDQLKKVIKSMDLKDLSRTK